ncbi:MAG: thioredoxin domain-containing protein [Cytophagales bacterium]|nr:thioredoxin domain-containing protein [Cytophagales bacterium]
MKKSNRLIHETSPYLLQHAHHPVAWYPWGEEALAKAKAEDKPILLSIGYATCHWCHVMAHETFEEEAIAAIMNKHFVCIKVDREERPDVDQLYMEAIQAMGLAGGWPLNVFLMPDQQPFYGGTYFPPMGWKKMIEAIGKAFQKHNVRLKESATQFTKVLRESATQKHGLETASPTSTIKAVEQQFDKLYERLDHEKGGMAGAPKFPMPSIGVFLLHYYHYAQDKRALAQLNLTLEKMAYGGIYDQLGGGFARYATDDAWRVPHFEKMLYDNGQLLSLYAEAYLITQKELYKHVVYETIAFIEREMMDATGGGYSALDADSEGTEGKFYVWTKKEIENSLGEDAPLLMRYFNVIEQGNWENGTNILYRSHGNDALASHSKRSREATKIQRIQQRLLEERAKRVRPSIDDKILTSWNGIMLKGLVDAYHVFGEERFLALALKNIRFIKENLIAGDSLWHSYKNGQRKIMGYLEDYAWVIQALIAFYQTTFEASWLSTANALVQYTMDNFYDQEESLFYFIDKNAAPLIARKKEIFDNVIPSSNSVMAHNLFSLGLLLDNTQYSSVAKKMLGKMVKLVNTTPQHLAHWASLYTLQLKPMAIIAIVGPQYKAWGREIRQHYYPGKVLVGAAKESGLPWLAEKEATDGETTIYVCYNKTCQLPVHSVAAALEQLELIQRH